MSVHGNFAYDEAFNRNLGWFTEAEQLVLRGKRIAIAGMGGVGAAHLLTLARLGIGAFNIADFDRFDIANFNRQVGANVHTIGRPKAEVMEEMALAINPELRIRRFDDGVTPENLNAFLEGVDLFVDGFDFFVIDIRRKVFARCHELGIPAVTAAPIGMGAGFLAFDPNSMSFEQYFRMEGQPELEQYLRFLVGLVPKALHRSYLVDPSRLNLAEKTGPSTSAACQLCAGVAAVMAIKFLLRRGDVQPAPWHHHFDAYRNIYAKTRLPFGLAGPMQRLKLALARRSIAGRLQAATPPPATFAPADVLDNILQAARWTPSGDNEQPWRFDKLSASSVRVHVAPADAANPYEYRDGEPIVLAAGMLLESLRIAASSHGMRMDWQHDDGAGPMRITVRFIEDPTIVRDKLFAALGQRSVDRTAFRARRLLPAEIAALEAALGDALRVDWYPTRNMRWRFARLSALATDIRLRAPETFQVHQRIIDWDNPLSPAKVPARALGLRNATLRIMRWAMQDWRRADRLNRLTGTFSAAMEMDYGPILSSAAAFALRFADSGTAGPDRILEAGIHIQRFWLTATHLGLALQPALAILIFADYGAKNIPFTTNTALQAKAGRLARMFRERLGADPHAFVFMGRIGEPHWRAWNSRSTRLRIDELKIDAA